MNRLLRIAWREYVAYIRTIGFWLSMILMPVGLFVAAGAPMMLQRSAPVPTLAVIDLSGGDFAGIIKPRLERAGASGKPQAIIVPAPVGLQSPQAASAALRPYLLGERMLPDGRKLDAVAVIHGHGEATAIDFWSASVVDRSLEQAVTGVVTQAMRGDRLKAAGMAPDQIRSLDSLSPKVTAYSPK
ncbi:MAG TPA: hypothetical protein VFX95_04495, partial [Caulobacteraceae bacterium]|nr:hypothetical protein [Caulobacteraceae bacterium]